MILTGEHEYKSARGTRAAQSVKRSTSAQVLISLFVSSSPTLGSALVVWSLFGIPLSPSLCPSPAPAFSLSKNTLVKLTTTTTTTNHLVNEIMPNRMQWLILKLKYEVEMQNGAASMGNGVEVPPEIKNRTPLGLLGDSVS